MKHAYLIIAHSEYPILQILLSMLDEYGDDMCLRMDKRAKVFHRGLKSFKIDRAGSFMLENPIKVYWGNISQVKAEYLLFETALANGPYAYCYLLPGIDLPIQKQEYIYNFCARHTGEEFVGSWLDANHRRDLERKAHRYYLFTQHLEDRHTDPFIHSLTSSCRDTTLILQKIIHYRKAAKLVLKKRPNWVSITDEFCIRLAQKKKIVLQHLRYALCPDEIFVQGILWNSPFHENIYCIEDVNKSTMQEIDWEREKSYTWRNKDYDELVQPDILFVRKFSSEQTELTHRIMETYKR